ncbi:hypothetical protein ACHAXS_011604 [Conticribra weissflogii]
MPQSLLPRRKSTAKSEKGHRIFLSSFRTFYFALRVAVLLELLLFIFAAILIKDGTAATYSSHIIIPEGSIEFFPRQKTHPMPSIGRRNCHFPLIQRFKSHSATYSYSTLFKSFSLRSISFELAFALTAPFFTFVPMASPFQANHAVLMTNSKKRPPSTSSTTLVIQSESLSPSNPEKKREGDAPRMSMSHESKKTASSTRLFGTTPSNSEQSNHSERHDNKQHNVNSCIQQMSPLVIVLAGPTAVGKSDVAAQLCSPSLAWDILTNHAKSNNCNHDINNHNDNKTDSKNNIGDDYFRGTRGHVVSADSVQAYRGVDIGANKPTAEEMEQTPHHLVNVVDPPKRAIDAVSVSESSAHNHDATLSGNKDLEWNAASSYNAADWMRDARYVIRELTSTNHRHRHNSASTSIEQETIGDVEEDDDIENSWKYDQQAVQRRSSIDELLQNSLGIDKNNVSSENAIRKPILPVVVGGTMMYLQWLVHGRPDAVRPTDEAVELAARTIDGFRANDDFFSPEELETSFENMNQEKNGDTTTESLRNEIDLDTQSMNSNQQDDQIDQDEIREAIAWKKATAEVSSLGPVFRNRVQKLCGRDWYRLRRLLEVAYTVAAKKKKSQSQNKKNIKQKQGCNSEEDEVSVKDILKEFTEKELYTGVRSGSLLESGYDVRCFFLCPDDRMSHFQTVDRRCEEMLLRGLLRETAQLYVTGRLPEESQVTRAIGYRQALDYLKRDNARSGDREAFTSFLDDFATATRQYAKKQMQWFRRDNEFAFIPVPMEKGKGERIKLASGIIADMCKLPRKQFEDELSMDAKEENENLRLSAQMKLNNEKQGKKMKFFVSKREKLVKNSDEFLSVLKEADECTQLVQRLNEF